MSLMREKSPTVSGLMAVGTLIGIGIPLYVTRDSNSWVSRGGRYLGGTLRGERFDEVGEVSFSASSAIRIWIIASNFSMNMSLASLD